MVILWILLIILGLILLILVWILLAPLIILIDTENKQYYVKIPVLFKVRILYEGKDFGIRYTVLGFSGTMKYREKRKKILFQSPIEKLFKRRKFRVWQLINIMFKYLRKFIRTFNLKKCEVNIGTGDYIFNSYLIPVKAWMSFNKVEININYIEHNSFYLLLHNRLIKLLWVGLGMYRQMRKAKVKS